MELYLGTLEILLTPKTLYLRAMQSPQVSSLTLKDKESLDTLRVWGLLKCGPRGYRPLAPARAPRQMSDVLSTKMAGARILNSHCLRFLITVRKEEYRSVCRQH